MLIVLLSEGDAIMASPYRESAVLVRSTLPRNDLADRSCLNCSARLRFILVPLRCVVFQRGLAQCVAVYGGCDRHVVSAMIEEQ
jgi:hypothetical protein